MKAIIILFCATLVFGCAADGTARFEARIPLGENGKYGTLIPGITYIPPEYFPVFVQPITNPPTLKDK